MHRTLFLICLLSLASINAFGDVKVNPELRHVQKLYIGSMGKSDEAERFRLLLDNALTKKGFTVVNNEQDADGVLTGLIVVRVDDDDATARATVMLKTRDGKLLWTADLEERRTLSHKDSVLLRAEDLAIKLKKDKERAESGK